MTTFDRNNPFNSELFERKVLMPYLQDYRNITSFARFMGGSDAIIYNKMQSKGEGDRIIFPLRQTFDPIVSRGNEQLEGNENELTYVTDKVDIGRLRYATLLTDEQMMNLQTKFQLDSDVKADLLDQADSLNTKRIISSFALAFPGAAYDANQVFDYSDLTTRMSAATLDGAGAGISRSRILFGNIQQVTYATLAAALLVANYPVAANKLTVAHIRQLAIMAKTGRNFNLTAGAAAFDSKESAIRPYKYKTRLGFEDKRYVLFISPQAYTALLTDPEWQAQTQRGVIATDDQPSILYGAAYKGTVEGVMVIEIPEFANLTITNTAGNTYAYSAFCGASAIGFAMGSIPTFTTRSSTDYGLYKGLAHNEISGLKVLKYPSKSIGTKGNNTNLTEYGLIHSFTTLA